MIQHTELTYGTDSRNRLSEVTAPTAEGARAALESFYYALNQRDLGVLRDDWADDRLVQLNNPLGGILRGGDAIEQLYERVFTGNVLVQVTFNDIVEYLGVDHAIFAGRESGTYTAKGRSPASLEIRTTRYFRYQDGRWQQYHHHGSIDDPDQLRAYQNAVTGQAS